jgi:pyridoxal phosphate enzyme (YggS family)
MTQGRGMEGIPRNAVERLAANLKAVRERIAGACARAGRKPSDVRLVAVTKAVGAPFAQALVLAGQHDLGENRPEEVPAKAAALAAAGASPRWHMIGHYQSRKIKTTLPLFSLVHSVHSTSLCAALDARARELGRRVRVLLQVNLAGEAAKQGFAPEALAAVVDGFGQWPALDPGGLMTMAPADLASADLRRLFAGLRTLRDRLARPSVPLPDLSMGMSGDFEEAVLEGATLVRVGSALFAGVAGAD